MNRKGPKLYYTTKKNQNVDIFSVEPVGSVPPKINSYSKFDEMSVKNGATLAILCPAQSFPVPAFR